MRDVTERIVQGALKIFIKKGIQGTTQEIAKEAGVAEVTLYRRYSTKENLFFTVVKNVLEKKFQSSILQAAKERDTKEFLTTIIQERLEMLTKNQDLIKMLLSESLKGNLSSEINLPEMIFTSLKEGLSAHFSYKNQSVDIDFCTRKIGGILLSYVVLPNGDFFHSLPDRERHELIEKHVQSILATIGEN